MDFERLERAWNGPANSPSEAASAYVVDEMMHTLKSRRQATNGFVGIVGLVLVLWTVKIGYDIVANPFPFDLTREWAVLPLFALPWAGLFIMQAQQKRHLLAHPDPYASTASTLRALLDENRMAQRRERLSGVLIAVSVILIAVVLGQLVSVGKMTPTNVAQGCVLFGVILGSISIYRVWRYFRVLKPEARHLQRLLADYGV